jgi:predicted nucleic acid-binding protein
VTVYLDSSALVKLVIRESESDALRTFLQARSGPMTTSALARTEVVRAVGSFGEHAVAGARLLMGGMHDVAVSRSVLDAAGDLALRLDVRSLDAIHLATAVELERHLDVLITYDRRMAAAAEVLGLAVVAPT